MHQIYWNNINETYLLCLCVSGLCMFAISAFVFERSLCPRAGIIPSLDTGANLVEIGWNFTDTKKRMQKTSAQFISIYLLLFYRNLSHYFTLEIPYKPLYGTPLPVLRLERLSVPRRLSSACVHLSWPTTRSITQLLQFVSVDQISLKHVY